MGCAQHEPQIRGQSGLEVEGIGRARRGKSVDWIEKDVSDEDGRSASSSDRQREVASSEHAADRRRSGEYQDAVAVVKRVKEWRRLYGGEVRGGSRDTVPRRHRGRDCSHDVAIRSDHYFSIAIAKAGNGVLVQEKLNVSEIGTRDENTGRGVDADIGWRGGSSPGRACQGCQDAAPQRTTSVFDARIAATCEREALRH